MPDEQGQFLPGGFAVKGQGGELRHGHRVVADLLRWTAQVQPPQEEDAEGSIRLRLNVSESEADPFWIEHAPTKGLTLVSVRVGRRDYRGKATLVARIPRLVIDAILEAE